MRRYRFSNFTLSPRRRLLLHDGQEVPLIPRYFDLLVFLVEHRHDAVHRRDIFDKVWPDVIVSDGALSQAIRTLRRALDDDSREPRFVRTVSRHGYRFVCDDVIEEDDLEAAGPAAGPADGLADIEAPVADVSWSPFSTQWTAAALGAALAGGAAGGAGGCLLMLAPGSPASAGIVPVLALVGFVCGGWAGAGVGGGLQMAVQVALQMTSQMAPNTTRAGAWFRRPVACAVGGALGGVAVGTTVQWMARWTLAALVGLHLPIGGGLEGLVLGGVAGLGYGWASARKADDPARASARLTIVLLTALGCGVAALALALAGRPLVGGTLHALADLAQGAQTSLAPLGRLLGEPGFGALTSALIATAEGAIFGAGLAWGLDAHDQRRPRRDR